MKRMIIILLMLIFNLTSKNGIITNELKAKLNELKFKKEKIFFSILSIETNNFNEKAINPITKASGVLQMYKIQVDEINRIIKVSKWIKKLSTDFSLDDMMGVTKINKKRLIFCLLLPETPFYTYDDRFNFKKSEEMFFIYNNYWFPDYNPEQVARSWGGGIKGKYNTDNYYNKFLFFYEK